MNKRVTGQNEEAGREQCSLILKCLFGRRRLYSELRVHEVAQRCRKTICRAR